MNKRKRECVFIDISSDIRIIYEEGSWSNGIWTINDTLCMSFGSGYYLVDGKHPFQLINYGDSLIKKGNFNELTIIGKTGEVTVFTDYLSE